MMNVPYLTVATADKAIFNMRSLSIEDMWDAYISMLDGFCWSRLEYEAEMLKIVDKGWS